MSDKAKQVVQTRREVLEAVVSRSQETAGLGRLKGKVGIITGVGPVSGIGTATARLFARESAAHLYLLDYNASELQPFAGRLATEFPATKVDWVHADASDAAAIENLVKQAMDEEGRLDFFFANAGIVQPLSEKRHKGRNIFAERVAAETPVDEYMKVMRVNALSVFLALKFAAPALAQSNPSRGKTLPGGSLILTASVAGLKANAGPLAYSASKAAVISMAQTAAYELVGQNIRVNAICPGLIQTNMTKPLFELAKAGGKEDKIGYLNPLLRQGLPAEVAQAALWLASDDSSYVNGQAIPVDGALSSSHPYVQAKL